MGNKLLILVVVLLSFSCKSQKVNSLQVINEKIGEEAVISYNGSEKFALVKQNVTSPQANFYSTNYLILNVEEDEILKEGRVTNGHIKWVDNETIEIFEQPGVIQEGKSKDDFKEIINVKDLIEKKK